MYDPESLRYRDIVSASCRILSLHDLSRKAGN
jgi:hypothetical protein